MHLAPVRMAEPALSLETVNMIVSVPIGGLAQHVKIWKQLSVLSQQVHLPIYNDIIVFLENSKHLLSVKDIQKTSKSDLTFLHVCHVYRGP